MILIEGSILMVIGREGACTVMVCTVASSGNFSASVLSVAVFTAFLFNSCPSVFRVKQALKQS